MAIDRFHWDHSSDHPAALAAFETAVLEVVTHRRSASQSLTQALAADPDLVGAHVLSGFAAIILGRGELLPMAATALASAQAALARRAGGTLFEREMVASLAEAVAGQWAAAAARIDGLRPATAPFALLAVKLVQALRFMSGDHDGMHVNAARAAHADGAAATAGHGYVLGCLAFTLEERGAWDDALATGMAGLAQTPDDAWGLHAIAHVHLATGRIAAGIAWIDSQRPVWSRCNNFRFHLGWHLGLLMIEAGAGAAELLDLYDQEIRPEPTDDYRDVTNASTWLWRLRRRGIAVGDRGRELAQIAARRRQDGTVTFAALHYLLAALGVGDRETAAAIRAELAARAARGQTDQDQVAAAIGAALADILDGGAWVAGSAGRLADGLGRIGGSVAQRDVFMQSLIDVALASGDRDGAGDLLARRGTRLPEDRFARTIRAALLPLAG